MAAITSIDKISQWAFRQFGSASNLNAQIVAKVNLLISNHEAMNENAEFLLQGASAGIEQAKIPMTKPSAPTGWTRDVSIGSDALLRITDGTTTPPGDSPTATGGGSGGSWTINGISTTPAGGHSHESTHTHTTEHSHTISSHYHGIDHTHTVPGHSHTSGLDGVISSTVSGWTSTGAFYYDTSTPMAALPEPSDITDHSTQHASTHWHSVGSVSDEVTSHPSSTESSNTTDSTATTSVSSTGTSSLSTGVLSSHTHTIAHDANWRPRYVNIIICGKD